MDLNASSRVNGFNFQNKTYATGSAGMISVAIKAPSVELGVTGVATHIETFKRQYGINPGSSVHIDGSYAVFQDGTQTGYAYYVPAVNRTFTGVAADGSAGSTVAIGAATAPVSAGDGNSSADVAYNRAYFAQLNVQRVIDVIQQRAVILGTSPIAAIGVTTALDTAAGWSSAIAAGAGVFVVSFLVEKIHAVDGTTVNMYGQPSTVTAGAGLLADLENLSLFDTTGTLVPLTSSVSSIKIVNTLPQVI